MKKAFSFCLTFLILGCVLAFAGGGRDTGAQDGTVTIEFFQQKGEEAPQRAYQAVIDMFHREYPQFRIQQNTVPDAPQVLTSRFVANDIPPLFSDFPTQLQFKEKIANGFIYDLTGQDFLTRINQSALDLIRIDGRYYAMPLTNNFMGVYYNIDIFNAHGISIPTTWEEFIAVCRRLQANGVQPLIFSFMNPGRAGHMFQAWSAALTPDGYRRLIAVMEGRGTIANDPAMLRMTQRVLEMVSFGNDDAFSIGDMDGMWDGFAHGRAAMMLMGSYARGTLFISNPNINLGVFPLPGDTDTGTSIIAGVDAALSISSRANAREREAALAYLEFLSRAENAQLFCDIEGAPNAVSSVVYPDPGMLPILEKMRRGPVIDWFTAYFPGNVTTAINSEIQRFLLDKNPAQFLTLLQQAIIDESR